MVKKVRKKYFRYDEGIPENKVPYKIRIRHKDDCDDDYIAERPTSNYRLKRKKDGTLVLEREYHSEHVILCKTWSHKSYWVELDTINEGENNGK